MTQWFEHHYHYLNTLYNEWVKHTQESLSELEKRYPWISVSIELSTSSSSVTCRQFTDVYINGAVDFSNPDAHRWFQQHYISDTHRFKAPTSFQTLHALDIITGNWVNHSLDDHLHDPLFSLFSAQGLLSREWLLLFTRINPPRLIKVSKDSSIEER